MNTKKVVLFAIFILFAPVSLYCKGGRGGRGRSSASSSFSGGRNRVPPASHSSSQSAFNKPVQERHIIHHNASSTSQQGGFFNSFFGSAAGSYVGNRMAHESHSTSSTQNANNSTSSYSGFGYYPKLYNHRSSSNNQADVANNEVLNDAELQKSSNESSSTLEYVSAGSLGLMGLVGARYAWKVWVKKYATQIIASSSRNILKRI